MRGEESRVGVNGEPVNKRVWNVLHGCLLKGYVMKGCIWQGHACLPMIVKGGLAGKHRSTFSKIRSFIERIPP